MFDRWLVPYTQRLLQPPARQVVRWGVSANQITVAGFLVGLLALPALAYQAYHWALLAIVLNRLADGLDGAVARLTERSDAGGYLDIVLDFIFYSAVVFGFALADPQQNALAAALLMLSFMGTGSSFLAFASLAAKRGIENLHYPHKSLYYMGGLTEGAETMVALLLFCLWPQYFASLAYGFATLCFITTLTRLYGGFRTLS